MADFLKARRIVISDKDFLFIVFGIDDDFRRYFCKLFCGGAVNIVVYRVKRDVLLKPDKFFVVTDVIIAAPPLGLNCKIRGLLHFDNRATRADCVNQPRADKPQIPDLHVHAGKQIAHYVFFGLAAFFECA